MKFKRCILPFSIVLAVFAGCRPPTPANTQALPPEPVLKSYSGLYKWSGESNLFTDCGNGGTYTMVDGTHSLDTLYTRALGYGAYPADQVFVALQGFVNPTGAASGVPDVLVVTKVDTVAGKNMLNCCLPYEFWCIGTEPFWSLQISKLEDGLFYSNANAQQGTRFPWSAPKKRGNTWVYESLSPDQKTSIRIVIKKEPCSDGMSDTRFTYSAEVTIGKEKLRGCAVRWGEPIPKSE